MRRTVRVAPDFFDDLDWYLGNERGPAGEPSATDFLLYELPPIAEEFAVDFDRLAPAPSGVPGHRLLLVAGRLVRAALVTGRLDADGSIVLIALDLDLA